MEDPEHCDRAADTERKRGGGIDGRRLGVPAGEFHERRRLRRTDGVLRRGVSSPGRARRLLVLKAIAIRSFGLADKSSTSR